MGTLISFSGIDGAGKSTQIKLLLKHLRENKKRVFATEEMFGYFFLKPFIGFLRKSTGSPNDGPVKRNKNSLLKLWFVPAFVDIWLGYILKIRPMLSRYDFVIADRFYTDIWANLLYYGYLPGWAFNAFAKCLPKSDCAILLSVKPIIVLKREREFSPNYYNEQEKIYIRLSQQANFYIIDANQEPKTVFKNIRDLLDQKLVENDKAIKVVKK